MQASDPPTEAISSDQPLKGLTNIFTRAPSEYASYRILVVDDNIINCQVAMHILIKLGCHADAAIASRDAIDMHARQAYDLILMDCQMPDLDGYQTAEQIRSAETANRRIPIIGWTSTLQAEEREKCIAAGMDDLMEKPIRSEPMREMMARWLLPPISLHAPTADTAENNLENTHKRFSNHFAELAALYRTDTLRRLGAIQKAARERDSGAIATIAHLLAGSCASIGAMRLSLLCRELENHCKFGFPENFDILLKEIQAEYAEIDARIRTLLLSATL